MTKVKAKGPKPLHVNITKVKDAGKPLPLKISFSIEISAQDQERQTKAYHAFGKFLAEVLSPEEGQQLMLAWEAAMKRSELHNLHIRISKEGL